MVALVGCEESQTVCIALREIGVESYSCDLLPCSGGHPEWHFQCDVKRILTPGTFRLQNGDIKTILGWDLAIFHPPCTRLCNSGVRWLNERNLWKGMEEASQFFKFLLDQPIPKIAVENPIPHKYALEILGRNYDQIVQPYMFGHGETKATCLWLKGLPKLEPTNIVEGREGRIHRLPPSKERAALRSKTFPGIAKAMAEQWGGSIL